MIKDSIESSKILASSDSLLKIPPLGHLIALKLYAGGQDSKSDILELIQRNRDVDLDTIRDVCKKYRLRGLDNILREMGLA